MGLEVAVVGDSVAGLLQQAGDSRQQPEYRRVLATPQQLHFHTASEHSMGGEWRSHVLTHALSACRRRSSCCRSNHIGSGMLLFCIAIGSGWQPCNCGRVDLQAATMPWNCTWSTPSAPTSSPPASRTASWWRQSCCSWRRRTLILDQAQAVAMAARPGGRRTHAAQPWTSCWTSCPSAFRWEHLHSYPAWLPASCLAAGARV